METHEKSQPDVIQKQINDMTDEMYKLAKPLVHIITIEKLID